MALCSGMDTNGLRRKEADFNWDSSPQARWAAGHPSVYIKVDVLTVPRVSFLLIEFTASSQSCETSRASG